MDKLKEVLKYQFWILLAVALIAPLVGWVMARSGLIQEAEARTKVLTDISSKLKASPDDPNNDWQRGVTEVNKLQQNQVWQAWAMLYDQQQKRMTWPPRIDPDKLDSNIDQGEQLELYRVSYAPALEKVRQIVKPVDEDGLNGLVDLPDALLPHPEDEWRASAQPPTRKEVEEAQEDLWLLTALLQPIAEVNKEATAQLDAAVRQILVLELRGGGGATASSVPAGGGGGGGGLGRSGNPDADVPPPTLRPLGGSQGVGSVSFNPDDEFGAQVPAETAAASGAAPTAAVANPDADVLPSRVGGFASQVKMVRYVDDKAAEWKTRGFYMELVMDHRKVPDLLVALANSEWPIRVTRVHQANLLEEELVSEEPAAGTAGARRPMARTRQLQGANPDVDDGGGRGGRGLAALGNARFGGQPMTGPRSAGGGAAPGRQQANSALDDHNLANVAIDGLITIFKKPSEQAMQALASSTGEQQTPEDQPNEPADDSEAADSAAMPAEEDARDDDDSKADPDSDEKMDEKAEDPDKEPPDDPAPENRDSNSDPGSSS